MNSINGVPWPIMTLPATWVWFSLLNSGPARPYNIHLKLRRSATSAWLDDITNRCFVTSGDSAFGKRPVQLDEQGLFMGVAERYAAY